MMIKEHNGKLTPQAILFLSKKYDTLDADSNVVRGVWNELEKYVVPYRGRMFTKDSGEGSVQWDKYDHYDSTAPQSQQTLAASVHGAIFPPVQWFTLNFKDEALKEDGDASAWLADTNKRIYHAIDNSNFSLESDELILDLTGFGHGFMISEADPRNGNKLTYSAISLKDANFEEGFDGQVAFFFRELEWTSVKLATKFGYDNLPDTIKKDYDNPKTSDHKFKVIFAIYPRDGFNESNVDTSKPLAASKRPWGHVYFMHKDKTQIGDSSGYMENPVYSVRWRKTSGSQWGHGPGHVCMGDIKQLNQHRLMRTRAVEKAIDPATMVTQRGLLSTLELGPRGLTVVKDKDSIWIHEAKANFSVSREELELLRQSIRESFYVDQLELKESPSMTASEVQVRYELMNRLLGPTQGRLKSDWLNRIIINAFKQELREGRLQVPPKILGDANIDIGIEYTGALSTSQKSQHANNITSWLAEGAELSQTYADIKYTMNAPVLWREVARLRNIPETGINDETEANKLQDDEAKVLANQQRMAERKLQGEADEAVGKGQQALTEAA